uniref:Uncharacterized protein n=1 Tax=Arundo donax TaxID=35708 RepID=A0A0A9DI97_ARUDO
MLKPFKTTIYARCTGASRGSCNGTHLVLRSLAAIYCLFHRPLASKSELSSTQDTLQTIHLSVSSIFAAFYIAAMLMATSCKEMGTNVEGDERSLESGAGVVAELVSAVQGYVLVEGGSVYRAGKRRCQAYVGGCVVECR